MTNAGIINTRKAGDDKSSMRRRKFIYALSALVCLTLIFYLLSPARRVKIFLNAEVTGVQFCMLSMNKDDYNANELTGTGSFIFKGSTLEPFEAPSN